MDKDIIYFGNKVYSPEFCIFVSQQVNSLFIDHKNRRGEWPKGVSYDSRRNLFLATCSIRSKRKHIGYFNSSDEAKSAYNLFKSSHIKDVAEENIDDKRLYDALIMRADLILKECK